MSEIKTEPQVPKIDFKYKLNKLENTNFQLLVLIIPSKMNLVQFFFSCQELKVESKYYFLNYRKRFICKLGK